MRKSRKTLRLALVTALTGALAAAPVAAVADADTFTSTASASVGKVDVTIGNEHIVTAELAQCAVDGLQSATTSGGVTGDIATFGNGSTSCGRTDTIATGESSGRRFETQVLRRFGGPDLKIRTFGAKCSTTTTSGSAAYIDLGQVTGFTVPTTIPTNYKITIPGGPAGTPMATVTVNEVVTPDPADGSLLTTAAHLKLFPKGGPAKGDIYLASARCNPYGKTPSPSP
ncbi:choice-of-anchor P family protein [Amycolatopsis sp. H20-H5]|uniref:choice-of-anchor P family protein n=1 Tax=Amycolatopsis sp. H20-H5 TaxID=3046309 RepID=UPI002DB7CD86|nr:choice-of-anchor P family protein [Amycolatopsis sp. H20-H5]MEC3981380.1 choice-of-anchor P family protein [Amycolatopsis sp. H20-H5]